MDGVENLHHRKTSTPIPGPPRRRASPRTYTLVCEEPEKVAAEFDSLVFEKGYVYTKNYEKEGVRPRSLMAEERFGVTRTGRAEAEAAIGASGVFDFPKPVRLIQHLVRIASAPDSIVMDFFAGSGTTAQAVMQQNAQDQGSRSFVLVQLAEQVSRDSEAAKAGYTTISELARARVRGAGQSVSAKLGETDIGFRVLHVDSSNLADTLREADATDQFELSALEGSIRPGRSGEDLLFHVLLDWGLELSLSIARETVDGHEVLAVDDDALIACFAESITPEVVRAIADRAPLRAVFRNDAFESDAARINAEQVFREVSPTTDVRTI